MRPLSLAILCYPSLGGSGVVASELAVGLAERGHSVHLLSSARPPRAAERERLHFHRVEAPGHPVLEHAPYTLAAASALIDLAKSQPIDLIQVHYAVPHAASALLARAALGARAPLLVTSLHGSDVAPLGALPAYRSAISAAIAASDGVTVPSAFLRAEALERLALQGAPAIEVLPNFVDTERFMPAPLPPPAVPPTLIHISNFRPVKRVGLLLDLFAHVRRARECRLLLVGDGPERTLAEERARALGVASDVTFLGGCLDVAPLLRRAHAFLMTSESESFGLAALEAMSSGLPVFAPQVGGLAEVVPPEAGFLAAPTAHISVLGDALLAAMAQPGRLEEMGRAGRRAAQERFGRTAALEQTERYFAGLLSQRAERSGR